MSFDWLRYLRLAEKLIEESGEENKRAAVSRAYYSVYKKASIYLEDKSMSPDTRSAKDTHGSIWKAFEILGHGGREIADMGDRLKRKRVEADYRDTLKQIDKWSKSALIDAQTIEKN